MERKRSAEVLGQKEGAYIPPAKLRMLQGQMVDKNSEESQRVNWERLKKKIHGQVNKVNAGNVVRVVRDLLKENVVRAGFLAHLLGLDSVFDRLRTILNEADIDTRVKYVIETIFHIRKDKFRAYPARKEELDLIDEEDQVAHVVNLEDSQDAENGLNVFKLDPNFEENEANYEEVRKQIIGSGGETSSEDEGGDEEDGEEAGDAELAENVQTQTIIDNTEQHMVAFRRKVYLSIQSSLDFQEAAHKLLKNHYRPGLERELCYMIVDCCAQERTYNRFFGLLAE
uniref:MI domain-containing protein n=1 Tax=Steinernema glaseri TaxID=37863 RepID=A0A1I7Z732_9BILA